MVSLGRKGRDNFIVKSLYSHSIYTMNDDATSLGVGRRGGAVKARAPGNIEEPRRLCVTPRMSGGSSQLWGKGGGEIPVCLSAFIRRGRGKTMFPQRSS